MPLRTCGSSARALPKPGYSRPNPLRSFGGIIAMKDRLHAILENMIAIVRQAGEIILANWEKPSRISHKGPVDLVTDTDFAVQEFLQKNLGKLLPEAEFLGEEHFDFARGANPADFVLSWIVDPVDGTTNFAHRIPCVAISVALCEKGKPIAGVVFLPLSGECFHAARGQGCHFNNRNAGVSRVASLQDAVAASGSLYESEEGLAALQGRFANILHHTQGLRMPGSAAANLAYVACGRMDAFFEEKLKPWDVAAGWLLVEEAGGKVTNYANEPFSFWGPICATNGLIHEAILKLIA